MKHKGAPPPRIWPRLGEERLQCGNEGWDDLDVPLLVREPRERHVPIPDLVTFWFQDDRPPPRDRDRRTPSTLLVGAAARTEPSRPRSRRRPYSANLAQRSAKATARPREGASLVGECAPEPRSGPGAGGPPAPAPRGSGPRPPQGSTAARAGPGEGGTPDTLGSIGPHPAGWPTKRPPPTLLRRPAATENRRGLGPPGRDCSQAAAAEPRGAAKETGSRGWTGLAACLPRSPSGHARSSFRLPTVGSGTPALAVG